jgi:shikimate O-hydroxycinnamoyltransferase
VGWVALSSSDLAVPVVHVEVVYAFQHSRLIANAAVELEDALGKVLVEYREWAGRLGKDAKTGRPAIELNDEGALFVEAVADGSLQELLPFDPSPLMLDLVPPNRGAPELLLAQVK